MIPEQQIIALLAAPGPKRYSHFIKSVCDYETIWVLENDNVWAMSTLDDGSDVLPLWPAREYAERCAIGEWSDFEPTTIELAHFLEVILSEMEKDSLLPGVFYLPSHQSVVPTHSELRRDLLMELERYN